MFEVIRSNERGAAPAGHRIRDRAIGSTGDDGRPGEGFGVECASSVDGDGEVPDRVVEHDVIGDDPRPSRPIAVLEDDVDAAEDFNVAEADIAQLAADVDGGKGTRSQGRALRRRFGCSVPGSPAQDRLPTE